MIERFHGIRDSELIDDKNRRRTLYIIFRNYYSYLIETADDVESDFSGAVLEQLHVDRQKQIDGVVFSDKGGQTHYHSSQFRLHVLVRVSDQILDNRQNVRQYGLFTGRLLQIVKINNNKNHHTLESLSSSASDLSLWVFKQIDVGRHQLGQRHVLPDGRLDVRQFLGDHVADAPALVIDQIRQNGANQLLASILGQQGGHRHAAFHGQKTHRVLNKGI
ncbi:hypothetical protein WR25_18264 [Diploscapter pachys]|uniref:Uncharacterized protein n=1 Tax=Diploscapter pachys TaxID=2018661 RepID=A0A2A2LMH7_9BILA|nr:hypothetical protein WR25_18264 [Diploscapter pachys]